MIELMTEPERERDRDRQTDRHRQTETQTQTQRETETLRERERERETDRQTDRQTDRDRDTERERETDRETERQREGERERGGGKVRNPKKKQHLTQTQSTGLRHPSFLQPLPYLCYAIGSRKVSANEQFFVGVQTVVSLLQQLRLYQTFVL